MIFLTLIGGQKINKKLNFLLKIQYLFIELTKKAGE